MQPEQPSTQLVAPSDPPGAEGAGGCTTLLVDAEGEVLRSPGRDDLERLLRAGEFFWLDLYAPTAHDLEILHDVFGFHPLAVEDSATFGQRPKIDTYDDFAFIVVYGAAPDSDGLVEMHCFTSERYLVTVRRDECPTFADLVHRATQRPELVRKQSLLLYKIVDGLVDSFFPPFDELDDRIDALQQEIFDRPRNAQLRDTMAMRQRLVGLRRVIAPQRDMLAQLVSGSFTLPGLTDESVRYFRDVYDHLIRLSDSIDGYRDLLNGVVDVYLSMVADRRDQIMKQLAIIATVFLPITFITGFFGQNFGWMVRHVDSAQAFVVGALLQLATAVGILAFFRRRGWL